MAFSRKHTNTQHATPNRPSSREFMWPCTNGPRANHVMMRVCVAAFGKISSTTQQHARFQPIPTPCVRSRRTIDLWPISNGSWLPFHASRALIIGHRLQMIYWASFVCATHTHPAAATRNVANGTANVEWQFGKLYDGFLLRPVVARAVGEVKRNHTNIFAL